MRDGPGRLTTVTMMGQTLDIMTSMKCESLHAISVSLCLVDES